MSQISIRFKPTDFFYLSSILLILLIINYRVINTWFIVDDTANIFCSSFDTIKLLFDRGTYLFFNQLFFTPLLPISFKLDWLLFKMNPTGYHLHNLLVAFLICVVFYKFLRIYIPSFFSWLGTILLSSSLPMSFDIGWINRRHYLWGFLFLLLTLYFFKKWEENKKVTLLLLSLFGTLPAFLFKEAYTFLPAIIFIISSGSIIDRIKKSSAYFVILAIYLVWRIYMIGGMGGYPGSTDKSFFFLLNKLIFMPMEMSENLFGFSLFPFVLLIIMAFLSFKMFFLTAFTALIVISPFVFFPSGSFLLANKALAFVAVISFGLSYILNEVALKNKKLAMVMIALLFIPISFGSILKSRDGQEIIINLSKSYEKASQELLMNINERILIISNYSYYFSNLEDIYRKMLKKDFPSIISISNILALPYLEINDFDRVVLANNLALDPDLASLSSVESITGVEATQFITRNREKLISRNLLPAPEVRFTSSRDYLRIDILDSRDGIYLRCLHMGSYVGCYPIPRKYVFKYNKVKKIEKVDIIYVTQEGIMSEPVRFRVNE